VPLIDLPDDELAALTKALGRLIKATSIRTLRGSFR
jgi:hypothetical protein